MRDGDTRRIRVKNTELYSDEYEVPKGAKLLVKKDEIIEQGDDPRAPAAARGAARTKRPRSAAKKPKAKSQSRRRRPRRRPRCCEGDVVARIGGRVVVNGKDRISIVYEEKEEREYPVPAAARLRVENGDAVQAGQQLTEGSLNPQDILRVKSLR